MNHTVIKDELVQIKKLGKKLENKANALNCGISVKTARYLTKTV